MRAAVGPRIVGRRTGEGNINAAIVDLGGIALTGSPSAFGKLIVEETEKWGKVVKLSGAKLD